MEILVRADRHVRAGDDLLSSVGVEVVAGLGQCAHRVSSAQVHLFTDSFDRAGPHELRCLLEVRPHEHAPLAVIHAASTHADAVRRATADMRGVLERMFRRIDGRSGPESVRQPV
jgi:hypothetical protein